MTHASVAGTDLEVPADLVRLSVGIETADDLLADLDQALAAVGEPASWSASTSAPRSPRRRWSTSAAGADRRRRRAPHDRRHRRARRVRRLPGRRSTAPTPARPTPRCWPAPAPAAACGSPSSATRSWSPPRPAAGSRCRAAARSSRSRAVAQATTTCDRARDAAPDVVLLTGGTDGGNSGRARRRRAALVDAGWTRPGRGRRQRRRPRRGRRDPRRACPHVVADNVVPRIGVLAPDGGRAAIREMFLAHVIGGKHLRASDRLPAMVRGATPDVVLTGVELLARPRGGRATCVVVDVGGATTDVHSVVALDPEDAGLAREVVAVTAGHPHRRGRPRHALVGAVPTVEAAGLADLARTPRDAAPGRPGPPARRRRGADADERIAQAAVGLALRRHAGRPGWSSAPRAGSSSAPARTCARSTCWSGPAACCGTAAGRRRAGARRQPRRARRGRLAAAPRAPGGGRPRLRPGRRRAARRRAPRRGVPAGCTLSG